MTRMPLLVPSELTKEQRELYDSIVGDDRRGAREFFVYPDTQALRFVFNAELYSPSVGHALHKLGLALRFESELALHLKEAAILAVAAAIDCDIEFTIHEKIARELGVSDGDIEAIRSDLGAIQDVQVRKVCELSLRLLQDEKLSDDEFQGAIEMLTVRELMELIALVGYYRLIAHIMTHFELSL